MATGQAKKKLDDLTPEQRAKVEAARMKWNSPEAREAEVRDRESLAEEVSRTGRIASTGDPVDPLDQLRFRRFAEELRAQRERAGLSLAAVAERSGIDQAALSRLENGRGNPTVQTLARYARAIGGRMTWGFEPSEVASKDRAPALFPDR